MTEQGTPAVRRRETLIDAIDRLVDVGTVVSGDVVIRLAEVDLIHLDLRLLLAAILGPPVPAEPTEEASRSDAGPQRPDQTQGRVRTVPRPSSPREPGAARDPQAPHASGGEQPMERLDQGLGQLVVAVVELVRQLLERQAVRRMRAGTLDRNQLERLGSALQALEQQMVELREALGVTPSELDRAIDTVEQMLDSSDADLPDAGGQQRRVS
ncbi:MAG: gas vesicle protein K [Candidatus Dormibacteraeota bacterium]|nr:gas vesicle protein K [Candidatus Dormibacteraeota bacterium]